MRAQYQWSDLIVQRPLVEVEFGKLIQFIAQSRCETKKNMKFYGLKSLKNYVVKDRDYKKLAFVLLGLGVFGLFFSVILFPSVGYHVFKWVSEGTKISPYDQRHSIVKIFSNFDWHQEVRCEECTPTFHSQWYSKFTYSICSTSTGYCWAKSLISKKLDRIFFSKFSGKVKWALLSFAWTHTFSTVSITISTTHRTM